MKLQDSENSTEQLTKELKTYNTEKQNAEKELAKTKIQIKEFETSVNKLNNLAAKISPEEMLETREKVRNHDLVKDFNNLKFQLADTNLPKVEITNFPNQRTAFVQGEFNIEFYKVLQEAQSKMLTKVRNIEWKWGDKNTKDSENKMVNIYELEQEEGKLKGELKDLAREITELQDKKTRIELKEQQKQNAQAIEERKTQNLAQLEEEEKKKQEMANVRKKQKELKKAEALEASKKLFEQQMQEKKMQEQEDVKDNDKLKNQVLNKMKELSPFVVGGCLEKLRIMAAEYIKEDPGQHKIALNASENGLEQQSQINEALGKETLSIDQIQKLCLKTVKGISESTDPAGGLHKSAQHFINAYEHFYNQENPLNHYNLAKEFIESIFSQHPKNSPDDIHRYTSPVFFHNDFSNRYINTMLCDEKAPKQTTHKNTYRTVEKFIEEKKLNIFQEFTVRVAGKYLYYQDDFFDSATFWHYLQMKDFLKSFKFTNPKEPNQQDFPKIKKVLSQEYQKITQQYDALKQQYDALKNSENIPIVINIEGEKKNESFTIRFTDNPIFHSYITKNDCQDNLASLAGYLQRVVTEKFPQLFNSAEIAQEEIEYYDHKGYEIDFLSQNQDTKFIGNF